MTIREGQELSKHRRGRCPHCVAGRTPGGPPEGRFRGTHKSEKEKPGHVTAKALSSGGSRPLRSWPFIRFTNGFEDQGGGARWVAITAQMAGTASLNAVPRPGAQAARRDHQRAAVTLRVHLTRGGRFENHRPWTCSPHHMKPDPGLSPGISESSKENPRLEKAGLACGCPAAPRFRESSDGSWRDRQARSLQPALAG